MVDNFYISVFETKNKAVFLFSTLESKGYRGIQLVSTPCSIKAGCNYAIKFTNKKYIDIIKKEGAELGINKIDIYFAKRINGRLTYKKIYV
ncbi:MAG: DUF3343 domain-containing protein [Tissierellia bacterium]|nr:DUF3343 domain-containing protein [Tissierellia bacterium]